MEEQKPKLAGAMIAWDRVIEKVESYVLRLSTPGGWGTGFLLAHSPGGRVIAIATAAHVIEHAHHWEDPIRIHHTKSGKSTIVRTDVRLIQLDMETDTAVLHIPRGLSEIPFPPESLLLAPEGKYLPVGNEIGWLGYPAIPGADLCFFSGRISAWSESMDSYLVDGNAIHGVSGGPAFAIFNGNLYLIGVVTAYRPNRATGEPLPGLAIVRSIERFHSDVAAISSFDQIKAAETPASASAAQSESKNGSKPQQE